MIFATTPYDPSEPEGTPGGSAYLSVKDMKRIAAVLAVLLLFVMLAYGECKKFTYEHICRSNLAQISKAIGLYAQENDDRLPPICASLGDGNPLLDDAGRPFTWVSLVSGYMNERSSFKCPAADEKEVARSQHPSTTKAEIPTTYGLYSPYSAYPVSRVSSPDVTVLVADTSTGGAQNTYDPVRFKTPNGSDMRDDAFAIGFSDSNVEPSKNTTAITRLAFPDTSDGVFVASKGGRHPNGINVLTVSGSLQSIRAPGAKITMLPTGELEEPWVAPFRSSRER